MFEHLTELELRSTREIFSLPDNKNNNALYLIAYRKLRELIMHGYFKTGEKLLSEAELANLMGIGRTSLRTALVLLCEDGYIQTFQGKGTFVIFNPQNIIQRYPEKYLLPKERLSTYSKNKEISYINVGQFANDYDSYLDDILNAQGETINFFMRNYALDGKIAIISNVYYKAALYPDIDFKDFDKTEAFLKNLFDNKIHYVECNITPALDPLSRKISGFDENNGNFILVSSIWYDKMDTPVVMTKDHYNGNYISFKTRFYKEPKS